MCGLPNGVKLGRLDHGIFKNSLNVEESQIYQPDLNSLILRIVKNEKYSAKDEKEISEKIRKELGIN